MIPYESKLSGIKDLEKRNEAYKELSIADKVREIGFDMLDNFITGRLKKQPSSSFVYWPSLLVTEFKSIQDPKEFQQRLEQKQNEILCSVCARGALMVSRIKLGNHICGGNTNFMDGEDECTGESILEEFTYRQLSDMEYLYEDNGFIRYEKRTPECIAAIAASLIQNGVFDKNDETDYLKIWQVDIDEDSFMVQEEESNEY